MRRSNLQNIMATTRQGKRNKYTIGGTNTVVRGNPSKPFSPYTFPLSKLLQIVPFAESSEVDSSKTWFQIAPATAIAAAISLLWQPLQHCTAIAM
jgi:hypothetical protein